MKKLNRKELQKITKKLKPFWKAYRKLESEHFKKVRALEDKMNKKIKAKTKLEFFYVDGECVGVGAENYSDRNWFPLIQDSELWE
jgi:hypothetical protein